MRLILSLLGTWIVALALGAVWAGADYSYVADAQSDDPFIITG